MCCHGSLLGYRYICCPCSHHGNTSVHGRCMCIICHSDYPGIFKEFRLRQPFPDCFIVPFSRFCCHDITALFHQFSHYVPYLLRFFPSAVYDLRKACTDSSVIIHIGKPQILVRQLLQQLARLIGTGLPVFHMLQQLSYLILHHIHITPASFDHLKI